MELLQKSCPRCGGPSANKSNPSGRCSKCLKKLKKAKKTPGSWQRAQTKADDALRRQKGKNGTASKKSSGLGSRKSIVKQTKTAERKTGQKLSPDRKNNSKGYAAKNTRMVPEKLNRGRHHVDPKKLAAWKKKLKKSDMSIEDLRQILVTRVLQTLEKNDKLRAMQSSPDIKSIGKMKFNAPEAGSNFATGVQGGIRRLSDTGSHFLKTGETNKQLFDTLNDAHAKTNGQGLQEHTANYIQKAYPHDAPETTAQREAAYTSLADKFFGMGKHIAKSHYAKPGEIDYGVGKDHPHSGADASISEVAKGGPLSKLVGGNAAVDKALNKMPYEEAKKFVENPLNMIGLRNSETRKAMDKNFNNGDAHKLSVMDYVMGNWDRHAGNIVADPESGDLKGIDHGTAFHQLDHHPTWGTAPAWISSHKNYATPQKTAQEVKKWVDNLSEDKLKKMVQEHGLNPQAARAASERLNNIKSVMGKHSDPMDAFNEVFGMNRGVAHPGDDKAAMSMGTKVA